MMLLALAAAAAVISYPATVTHVIDGDTVQVHVAGWPAPFDPISVRIYGLDTPESRKPPAKKVCEVALGKRAKAFAQGLVAPGQPVQVIYTPPRHDKYGRLLAQLILPDGRDWAGTMIAGGYGRAYGLDGKLTKKPWC